MTDVVGIASCKESKARNKRRSYRFDRIINISAPYTHEVTSTNSKAITVSPHRDNLKFRIRKFGSLCEWQHPAVQRMDAICLDKVRRLTGASDAGKYRGPVWWNLQVCKRHLYGI